MTATTTTPAATMTRAELRDLLRHPDGMVRSLADWYAHYTGLRVIRPVTGTPELRAAFAAKYKADLDATLAGASVSHWPGLGAFAA